MSWSSFAMIHCLATEITNEPANIEFLNSLAAHVIMPSLRQMLKGAFSSKGRDINDYNSANQYSSPQTGSYSQSSGAQQPASPFRPSYCYPSQPYYYSPSFAPQPVPHPFPTTAIQARCTPHQMDNSDPHHRHHVEMGMMRHSKSSIILSMFLRPLHCYMTVNLTNAEMSIKASNTFRLQLPTGLDPDLNRVTAETCLQLLS